MSTVSFSEIVTFENGVRGLVLDLLEDSVGILVLGDYASLTQGGVVTGT
jgi:F-type H+-transporting ATPase subunit alpha